jgi:predicted lactoylglutathione lyase
VRTPTFSVEVITLPVSDVERALRFYVDHVGFTLNVAYSLNDAFRVVRLDPTRAEYASCANFSDPDGDSWVLQERGYRK